jgi:hypothetical protein
MSPLGGRSRTARYRLVRRRQGWLAVLGLIGGFLSVSATLAVPLQVTHSTETVLGLQAPAQFLSHWQQVGSEPGTIPVPVPGTWSGAVATPTRLPRAAAAFGINPSTSGDLALLWFFNETTGIAPLTEIELTFHIQSTVGTVTSLVTVTAYIETQRRALFGPLAFTVYWDAGAPTGVTFNNQLEVAQVCSAVGTCP